MGLRLECALLSKTRKIGHSCCACRALRTFVPAAGHRTCPYPHRIAAPQEEKHERFKPDSGHIVRPGADNFFDGGPYAEDNPVAEQQMVAAAREYYRCFSAKNVEAALTGALCRLQSAVFAALGLGAACGLAVEHTAPGTVLLAARLCRKW